MQSPTREIILCYFKIAENRKRSKISYQKWHFWYVLSFWNVTSISWYVSATFPDTRKKWEALRGSNSSLSLITSCHERTHSIHSKAYKINQFEKYYWKTITNFNLLDKYFVSVLYSIYKGQNNNLLLISINN